LFLDYAKISIKSGDGGRGCISFRREKFVPKGGPNGGDGGKGGNIIIRATSSLSTLIDFRYKKHYKASNGEHGKGGDKTGKNGKDCIILLPCGSIIKDEETGNVISELLKDGDESILLRGGKGGRGNTHFKTPTNQAPRFAEDGQKGEERNIIIELKLIADIGLVGFPNSGKSTLISKISAARPKIADYPFTTLVPNLGIVKYRDYDSFVVADIPGIIEGASAGKGLGLRFLRHIERTKILLFLIDILTVSEEDIMSEYYVLENELKKYSAKLLTKPKFICFTKADAANEQRKAVVSEFIEKNKFPELEKKPLIISSVTGEGTEKLKDLLFETLTKEKSNS